MGALLALALLALVGCTERPGAGGGGEAPGTSPWEPAMPDDPAVVALLKGLQPGQGLRLPAFAVQAPYGGLDAYPTFESLGPGIRDYSMKWVYASDRGSALYAGANHGQPHKFDDVWEYFLGANTWVLLHPPDADARPLHTWWGLTYDPRQGRLYWMAPQSAVSDWPLISEHPDPPLVYFEPASPQAGWRYLPTTPAIKPGFGSALEYVPDAGSLVLWSRAWDGAGLQRLDPTTKTWTELISHEEAYFQLRDTSPRPEALVGYNPGLRALVAFVDRDVFLYRFDVHSWRKVAQNALPEDVQDNVASLAYDPKRDLHFLVVAGRLLTFDPDSRTVEDVTPANFPDAGRLLMLYVDPRFDVVVVYEKGSGQIYVYRPRG